MTAGAALPHVLVAHARNVPAPERERLADRILDAGDAGFLLRTCHRVELYASDPRTVRQFDADLPPGIAVLSGDDAARHVISVAVGLDSVMLGEDQILHQLRTATTAARSSGTVDPVVDRLVGLALRAGRQARSWRSGPTPSLADAALAAVERRVGTLAGRRVLVVGAGEMGMLAAKRARSKEAIVTLASRTIEHARLAARQAGIETAPMDPGTTARELAAVIVATRGPWEIGHATVEALIEGAAVVVDLSVPMAVPERVAVRLGARFVSIDRLAVEPGPDDARADVPRMRTLVDATVAEFASWMDRRGGRVAAHALAERAEHERLEELDKLWLRMPQLEPEARSAIERMSRHLASRILREPLERLGRDADGRAERAARELFAL
ncbi:MAG: NAD(P)-binding domain-containing protein [Chloroflexota bacterium]